MRKTLFAWIGHTDLRAAEGVESVGIGPIAEAVVARDFGRIVLLTNWDDDRGARYAKWLRSRSPIPVDLEQRLLSGPTEFGEIYEAARGVVDRFLQENRHSDPVFHLSPGTPAMAAVWIILGKTRFNAELIESARESGVRTAAVPFEISAEFLPDLLRRGDERLGRLSAALPPDAPEFADIVQRSAHMRRAVALARRVASRSVTVLLEGESGTGKELLARAIHGASRRSGSFVAVNCGAIPRDLVESHLFGHKRGSFTGAVADRAGFFEAANHGTAFLDEIGELPLEAQVKLLRVLQEQQVTRLGEHAPRLIDVRIIAATNRNLASEVSQGRFREDLFYRLAVVVISLPSLRERVGDMGLLIDRLLAQINAESQGEPGYVPRTLSAGARNALLRHMWPGNVRELLNTLRRGAVWSDDVIISADDIGAAMLPAPTAYRNPGVLDRPLGRGFDIDQALAEVARHYLGRALKEANGNKSRAAQLVGLRSYQTFTNWMKRYGSQ